MPTIQKQTMKKSRPKGQGVLSRITDLEDDFDETLKMLIYGRSGTGKTTFWGSFPGPILAIVCSGGVRSGELKSLQSKELLSKKKISKVVLESPTELNDLIAHQQETGEYKTIVLDHATGFQDRVLAEVLGVENVPVQKSWGLASQQQYGQCTAQCKEYFARLLGLDCNVVIVAQERDFNTDQESLLEGINPYVAAALSPSLVGWLNPATDYVCQTLIRPKTIEKQIKIGEGPKAKITTKTSRVEGEVEYVLRVAPHDVVTTKFRLPKGYKLPQFVVDPSYDKVMKLIREGTT